MTDIDNRKEACRTYVEQTRLLVTLASAFVLAPAAAIALVRPPGGVEVSSAEWWLFVGSNSLIISSILCGYAVLGSIAGSQHSGTFNVFRPATRVLSLVQMGLYLLGVIALALFVGSLVMSATSDIGTRRSVPKLEPIQR